MQSNNPKPSLLELARSRFFSALAEKGILTQSDYTVKKGSSKVSVSAFSNADQNNRASVAISSAVAEKVVPTIQKKKLPPQKLGTDFEQLVTGFLEETFLKLAHLRPGKWSIIHVGGKDTLQISELEQYSHLADLERHCRSNKELAAALGNDYTIAPDILVTRQPELDSAINHPVPIVSSGVSERTPLRLSNNSLQILHACISCKFTLRSDRSQNARSEALNLIRNRKGRTPHIAVVTAECLPSRLGSLGLGTGDIDCLYHIALPELVQSISEDEFPDAYDQLHTMLEGKRLKDLTDLPLDLSI